MQTTALKPNANIDSKPWYAHRWPWLLMLGPFLVILAGSYTCWIAFSQQDALVVDDYYKQGKAINQDLRRDVIATKLAVQLNMRYDPRVGTLSGQVDSFNKPLAGKFILQLIHSTQPEKDIKLLVQTDSNGVFSVALPMLEMARWQVLIENENLDWRLNGVWSWPHQQTVQIKADPAPVG